MFGSRSPDIAALLPREVVTVVATPRHQLMPLLEAEADYLASRSMQPQRKAEFRAGRACAREALARLGFAGWPLLPAATREPKWPDGFVGSITHCDRFCAAAVSKRDVCAGIGIDAETISRVSDRIAPLVCTDGELRALLKCRTAGRKILLALIFSAKESVFKAVFPSTRLLFDLKDIELTIEPGPNAFSAHAQGKCLKRICKRLEGRFELGESYLVTTALLND